LITAVDTCVLLDVLGADARFGERSAAALRTCIAEGGLVACEVVWAEIAGRFERSAEAQDALARLRIDYSPTDDAAASAAGDAWRAYRRAGGARERMVADFLIGAHAAAEADRLLTRDRGFYRRYFGDLEVLDPSEAA
jgi:predicted nucleic acid-binding protein